MVIIIKFLHATPSASKAAMISVELWRATIGLSSSKCYSGSLSSLSCPLSFKFRRRSNSDVVRQYEPPGPTCSSLSPPRVVPPNSSPRSSESLIQQSLRSLSSFIHYVHCSFHCGLHLLQDTLVRLVLAILVIISQSLIISGDIELNPGPDPSESC